MSRTTHIPLWTRILLLAGLNLALLAAVFGLFLRSQLQPDLESFLMAGARDRIAALAAQAAVDLRTAEPSERDSLFQKYSDDHGVQVLLYRNTGMQLAGAPTVLPAQVDARIPRPGPGRPPSRPGERGGNGERRGPPPDGARGGDGPPPDGERGGPFDRGGRGGPQEGAGRPFLVVTTVAPKYWIGLRMPVIELSSGEQLRSVLILVSNSFFANSFFFEAQSWLGMGAAAVLLSALCWLPLVHNLTRSIADMMRATGRIAEGRFDVEVSTQRHDELGRLGTSIKQMAGRLESFTAGRTRFLGSVAHELRSPIARMQLAAEILERNTLPDNHKYIEYLKEDIETMSRLTDELLQLARAESAPGPVKVQPVNVAEVVEAAVRQESAEGAGVHIDVAPSIHVQANRDYLVRAVGNVLRNAVRYAGGLGPIALSATRLNEDVILSVTDCGPGIPEGDLEKVFMPFYRIDDARDRRTGGTGLGMAIVRSCIEACGGKVVCMNQQPNGLKVVITLRSA